MKRLVALFLVLTLMLLPIAYADTYEGDYLYAETDLYDTSDAGRDNIDRVIGLLNGLQILPGELFSFNDAVGPRTREYGYRAALNGRGVTVYGGGVAQVASTIYLAAAQSDGIYFEDLAFYGDRYEGSYVASGDEAVITDYKNGQDFSFWNDTDCTMQLDLWVDDYYDVLCCGISMLGAEASAIGYAETPLYGSQNKLENISLCSWAITGLELDSYDLFSFNDLVGPRTAEYGYKKALNGRGVTVYGGGVAQVASTVYLAVKDLYCVEIIEKSTYGDRFTDGYVDDPDDAIVTDYKAGTDFSFYYTGDDTLFIDLYEQDGYLCCAVYEY